MADEATDIVEMLVTAEVYTEIDALTEDDIPPRYREGFRNEGGDRRTERPVYLTTEALRAATGIDEPWEAVSDLSFVRRDGDSTIELARPDEARDWIVERIEEERLETNPALAYYFEGSGLDVNYDDARESVRPAHIDREWIDEQLSEVFDDEDDEEAEMLDLVDVRAPEEIEFTLDELVLTEEQEREINRIAKTFEYREYLDWVGLREIGKLLFVGPPGTGKTSTARALAGKFDLPLVEVKLSMITSQYLGETSKNVEKTFEVARRLSPCIMFIDEFDFVAKTRRSDEHAAVKRAVNTLLKSIDEISLVQDDVLLISATNHPDQLDDAAWRRFDKIVNFPRPDREMRADILRVVSRKMEIEDFDPEEFADRTEGLTGSDLRVVLREAMLDALVEDRTTITRDDLLDAVQEFEQRDEFKGRIEAPDEDGTTADD